MNRILFLFIKTAYFYTILIVFMNDDNRHLSEEEILDISKRSVHKTFGELGLIDNQKANKGGLGTFVERNVFGYDANNDANPDFIDAGIELKVTPVKKNQNQTFSSKERLVLNMINYGEEVNATFETSSFYHKNKKLLIWYYLYTKGLSERDFEILDFDLFEFEKTKYYQTIKHDWEIIHNKIVQGKAHEISESDTTFLSACTKGADSSRLVSQPNSSMKAKPRAYSFKSSYMTQLFRELIHASSSYLSYVSEDEWLTNPLEDIYISKLSKYYGLSISELANRFYLNKNDKGLTFKIAQKMLNLRGKETSTSEMLAANIKLKTVRVNADDYPYESMSFPYFDFSELISTKWKDSEIREDFIDWKLMIFVFKDDENKISRFQKVIFWNIPNKIVDGAIKKMYEDCAKLIKEGNALYFEGNKIKDRFPKEIRNSNGICHIRPHGQNKEDRFALPVPDRATGLTSYTKQCFWFNKKFMQKIIKGEI